MDLNWGGGGVIEKGHKERHIFKDYVVHVYFCEYIDYILPWYQRERHEFYEVHIVLYEHVFVVAQMKTEKQHALIKNRPLSTYPSNFIRKSTFQGIC